MLWLPWQLHLGIQNLPKSLVLHTVQKLCAALPSSGLSLLCHPQHRAQPGLAALSPASPPQASLEPSCSSKLIHLSLHCDKVSLQPVKTNLVPWETPGLQNLFLFEISIENTKTLYLFTTLNIRNHLLIFLKGYIYAIIQQKTETAIFEIFFLAIIVLFS